MIDIRVYLASEVEANNVWVTAVIYESSLIAVEHAVEAEREEFIVVCLLNDLLSLIGVRWVIQVK